MMTIGSGIQRPALLAMALVLLQGASPGLARSDDGGAAPVFQPPGYVSDEAAVIEADWQGRIRGVCRELEDRTGVRMIVVTVPTVGSFPHAQAYAQHLYERWHIGTARQKRGLVLLVSLKERQAVVVLGRTLLSEIGGAQLDRLSERYLRPMFQHTRYGESLHRLVVAFAEAASGVVKEPGASTRSSRAGFLMNLAVVVSLALILWQLTRPERRRSFQRWRRGDYWGTGRGGFGGAFGGFGGRGLS